MRKKWKKLKIFSCGICKSNQENSHLKTFEWDADEPPMLAGKDRGANPVEHLLAALAACLTTTLIYHAAIRGIKIDELESDLEGDIDLRGFLGLTNEVRMPVYKSGHA